MKPRRRIPFLVLAVLAPIVAVAPIALGLDGAWIALHLIGGAIALAILIHCCWKLNGWLRWLALIAVAVAIATISVTTGGGAIGPVVQILVLIGLGSIYIAAVGAATAR